MFLRAGSPMSSNARSSLPVASSCTRADTHMPPGSATPSSRAATFTPSPKMSPSSTTMSPTLMPMRNSMRLFAGVVALRSTIPVCTSVAHCRASTTLLNSTRRPSPVVLTSRPLCAAIVGSISSARIASALGEYRPRPHRSVVSNPRHQPPRSRQDGGLWSFFWHPGLAQAGEIGGFIQCADLWHAQPYIGIGLQAGDARKRTSAAQPTGFGKLAGAPFGFAPEGIGGGEAAANDRYTRRSLAGFLEPDDRLVGVRVHQICGSNHVVE